MIPDSEAHALVYQALDQVLTDKVISPGTSRAMHAAIDTLKTKAAPSEHVRSAENIAIEIHRLQWTLQQADKKGSQAALRKLKSLAGSWVDMRIRSKH
jgi:hypothetical protein